MAVDLLDLPPLEAIEAKPTVAKATPSLPAVAVAKPVKRAGPTKKAIAQYREAVLKAVESGTPISKEAVIFPAYRTVEICIADFKLYRSRLQSKHCLDVVVGELEKKAVAAEEVARQVKPWRERTFTGAQWEILQASGVLAAPPQEALAAQQARFAVQEAKQNAIQHLRETSDPELSRQISELSATAQEIRGSMTARQQGILNIDSRIVEQRQLVDAIIRGDDLVSIIGPVHRSRGEENAKARRKLDMLQNELQLKPQAVADQAADAARLAELQAEIGKLEAKRLDPRQMKWA